MSEPSRHIVAVGALFLNAAGEVLLVRTERRGWECPGGQVEEGEDLLTALVREVEEESGCAVEVERLVGVYTNPLPPAKVMFMFRGRHLGGVPRGSDETPESGWFAPERALELVTNGAEAGKLRDALVGGPGVTYRIYQTRPYLALGEKIV